MDRVIRDDLDQATSSTDIWMRYRKAAQLYYTAKGDTDKADQVAAIALARSLDAADWLASYEKFFGPGAEPIVDYAQVTFDTDLSNAFGGDFLLVGTALNDFPTAAPTKGAYCWFNQNANVRDANDVPAFGTGDFTFECRVLDTFASGQGNILFDGRPLSTQGPYPALYTAGDSLLRWYVNGADRIISTSVVRNGADNHIAICRFQGVTRMFINGVQEGGDWADTTDYQKRSDGYFYGSSAVNNGTINNWGGWFDDVRVCTGARYPSGPFTPPNTSFA
jgi:hypothetical protein